MSIRLGTTEVQEYLNITSYSGELDPSNYYTKTEVDNKISDLVDGSPEVLDTLNELATALGNDANFSTTVLNSIGEKANSKDVYTKSETEAYVQNYVSQELGDLDSLLDEIIGG